MEGRARRGQIPLLQQLGGMGERCSGGSRKGAMGGRLVGGAAGGGAHPLTSKGVWGSAVSSPIGAWGGAPEAFTFFASKPLKSAYSQRSERIYIRAKDNEVYCDNAPRNV